MSIWQCFLCMHLTQKFWGYRNFEEGWGSFIFNHLLKEARRFLLMILSKYKVSMTTSRRNYVLSSSLTKHQGLSEHLIYITRSPLVNKYIEIDCLSEALCRHHSCQQLMNQCFWSNDISKKRKSKILNPVYF